MWPLSPTLPPCAAPVFLRLAFDTKYDWYYSDPHPLLRSKLPFEPSRRLWDLLEVRDLHAFSMTGRRQCLLAAALALRARRGRVALAPPVGPVEVVPSDSDHSDVPGFAEPSESSSAEDSEPAGSDDEFGSTPPVQPAWDEAPK